MNNTIKYLAIALLATVTSCSLLEPVDENILGEDRLNFDPAFAEGLLLKAYNQDMPYQTSNSSDIATDDATHNYAHSIQRRMAQGEWSPSLTPTSRWHQYESVLFLNKFLDAIDNVVWSRDDEKNQLFKDRNRGEALAMRALRHLWILQEHAGYSKEGVLLGIPYIETWLEHDADFNMPRLTFEETLEHILMDFDEALTYLPYDYSGNYDLRPTRYDESDPARYSLIFGPTQEHRICGKYINAYKAKLHLMAASPSFFNGNGHYEKASALLVKLINEKGGVNGLDPQGHHNFFTIVADNTPEHFWRKGGTVNVNNGDFEKNNFPPSLRGKGQINPSQNLVDAFYMSNGYPVTHASSGYNANDPYANRDPRLKLYILYNGNTLGARTILTGVGGGNNTVNAVPDQSTRTGYYIKKHTWESMAINSDNSTTAVRKRDFLIRYTDLYLMLAEALNEIGGPTYVEDGLSAEIIIQKLRNRALGIATDPYLAEVVAAGKESMRDLIRNERRLELCFEGHRHYDLRRWGLLNSALPDLKGAYYTGVSYDVFDVEDRNFPDHGNYSPFPLNEVLKFSNLQQNRGW
jgi:starch-binding outer membrane protein, SusD/RagB family